MSDFVVNPKLIINLTKFLVFFSGVVFGFSRIIGYDAFLAEKFIFFAFSFFLFIYSFGYCFFNRVGLKKNTLFLFLFFSVFVFSFVFLNLRISYLSSTLFLINIIFLIFIGFFVKNKDFLESNGSGWVFCFWVYIFFSISLYFSGNYLFFEQGNRFIGFWVSPTTFTIWLLAIYILAYSGFFCAKSGPVLEPLVALLAVTFIVYVSGTRVNLMFCFFIGFVVIFKPFFQSEFIRIITAFSFLLFVAFSYHIFEFLSNIMGSGVLSHRFEGASGMDDSFLSRIFYFNLILDEILRSDFLSILFGHGSDASRVYLMKVIDVDIYPHNDVIRFIYEYGVIFSLFFFVFVVFFASGGIVSFLFVCLYIISFMHNMLFSHYLIMLIIVFGSFCCKNGMVNKNA